MIWYIIALMWWGHGVNAAFQRVMRARRGEKPTVDIKTMDAGMYRALMIVGAVYWSIPVIAVVLMKVGAV